MGKITKGGIIVLVGTMALTGLAQAETRFAVRDSTGTTKKMVVTDKGYIGVGTDSPTSAIQAKGQTADQTQIISHYIGTELLGGGFLAYRSNLAGSTPVLPKMNDRTGYLVFGSVSDTGTPLNGAAITGYAESDWTSTTIPSSIRFEVAPSTGIGRIERMRITSSGKVGIGTVSPAYPLDVYGQIRTTTGLLTGSDMRLKKNRLQIPDALNKVLRMDGVSYEWRDDVVLESDIDPDAVLKQRVPAGRHFGVIAQEIEQVLPEVVNEGPDGIKAVAYQEIIPFLIEAIKEQQRQIQEQQRQINQLSVRLGAGPTAP